MKRRYVKNVIENCVFELNAQKSGYIGKKIMK